jgi:hypothetical protein
MTTASQRQQGRVTGALSSVRLRSEFNFSAVIGITTTASRNSESLLPSRSEAAAYDRSLTAAVDTGHCSLMSAITQPLGGLNLDVLYGYVHYSQSPRLALHRRHKWSARSARLTVRVVRSECLPRPSGVHSSA